jgi:glycosyltransferase involved in cell wall biosynthesis
MKVLVVAYACAPGEGSEPGAGWAFARMIARTGEAWVITRRNNQSAIEQVLPSVPERASLHFVYVDLPSRWRRWKHGQRGIRLYYLLWLWAARRMGRTLDQQEHFDVVWHTTLANAWLGSLSALDGRPFIFGPVGGGVSPPLRLALSLGPRGVAFEVARWLTRAVFKTINPAARLAWRHAQVILVQNPETRSWLPRRHRGKCEIFFNAVVEEDPVPHRGRDRVAIFAGRLLPWKGLSLVPRVLQEAPGWRVVVAGSGWDANRVKGMCQAADLEDRMQFLGSVPRLQLLARMQDASVFLFPSLHDDAPLAVVEAILAGLPVICLDRGGPPLLAGDAGVAVSSKGGPKEVSHRMAEALKGTLPTPSVVGRRAAQLSIECRGEQVRDLLNRVVSRGGEVD